VQEDRELQFSFFEEMELPEDVLRKIYRDNAMRLFGLKKLPEGNRAVPDEASVGRVRSDYAATPKPDCCENQ